MSRRRLVASSLAFALLVAAQAGAGTREETIRILEGIEQSDSLGLEAWLNTNTPSQIQVGDEVGFRFRSATDVYLTTLYVDASGAVMVLHSGDEQLIAGHELAFPPPSERLQVLAEPPLGTESVFAIATPAPLSKAVFLDENGRGTDIYPHPEAGRRFAERLAEHLGKLEATVDVVSFDHRVVQAGAPRRFRSTTIVDHFTIRTRSVTRPKLHLDIHFSFGSAELTRQAMRNLDELGKALEHPVLKQRRFELAGHTDDVGDADYNMNLSKRRADSAYAYLLSNYDVDPDRLGPTGYGETKPAMPGSSAEARRRNRRVVIEQRP